MGQPRGSWGTGEMRELGGHAGLDTGDGNLSFWGLWTADACVGCNCTHPFRNGSHRVRLRFPLRLERCHCGWNIATVLAQTTVEHRGAFHRTVDALSHRWEGCRCVADDEAAAADPRRTNLTLTRRLKVEGACGHV
jgi:hypothetical protein